MNNHSDIVQSTYIIVLSIRNGHHNKKKKKKTTEHDHRGFNRTPYIQACIHNNINTYIEPHTEMINLPLYGHTHKNLATEPCEVYPREHIPF